MAKSNNNESNAIPGEPLLKDLPLYNLSKMKDENGVACTPKGGVACPFPWRLHECLEAVEREGLDHIVSWQPHGRAFTVHLPDKFVELVLPRYVCMDASKRSFSVLPYHATRHVSPVRIQSCEN